MTSKRVGRAGLVLLFLILLVAVLAGVLAPYDPNALTGSPFERPSPQHLLGTNDIGQDILSELLYGARTSLLVGALSTAVTLPVMIATYRPMSAAQLICLLLAGAAATGGQFCITAAYRRAPAKEIAVFDYMQVFFAAILGFFFLDQIPKTLSFIGYAVIVAAAVGQWAYHMVRARRARRTAESAQIGAQAEDPPPENEQKASPPPDERMRS